MKGEQLERLNSIYNYSRRYKITTEMATSVYDAAVAEKIDPALAFPLVRLESRFNPKAISSVGAVGLTQLMIPTARGYVPGVTREDLYDRDLNLTIGFRHLRGLIKEYRGDVQLALLVPLSKLSENSVWAEAPAMAPIATSPTAATRRC